MDQWSTTKILYLWSVDTMGILGAIHCNNELTSYVCVLGRWAAFFCSWCNYTSVSDRNILKCKYNLVLMLKELIESMLWNSLWWRERRKIGRNEDAILVLVRRMLSKLTRSWRFSFPQSQIESQVPAEKMTYISTLHFKMKSAPEMTLERCTRKVYRDEA